MSRKPECPKCGSRDTVPIAYGMPTYETFLESEQGKVVLGGCCIEPEAPDRACKSCGHCWLSRPRPPEE